MKKFYFIILAVFIMSLSSCSSDDNGSSNSQINPPNWIQGLWMTGEGLADTGFRFTSNDITIILINTEVSQKGYIKQFTDAGQNVSTNEEMDENSYSIILNYPAGQSVTYSFTRISDSKITWDAVNNSVYIKH